jgi:hypothetical protein
MKYAIIRYANYNPGNYSSSEQQLQSHDPLPSTSGYYSNNISEQTLVIPPPPKREEFLNFSKLKRSDQKFEFARVPTANASFPLNFDSLFKFFNNNCFVFHPNIL